jgi:hypothetical protein
MLIVGNWEDMQIACSWMIAPLSINRSIKIGWKGKLMGEWLLIMVNTKCYIVYALNLTCIQL